MIWCFLAAAHRAAAAAVVVSRRLLVVRSLPILAPSVAHADWREKTALAPLGPATRDLGAKATGLSREEMARRLIAAATRGATGGGGYLVSGDIDYAIFADDCRFVDPTNDVTSLARYSKALSLLFDPSATGQTVSLVGEPRVEGDQVTATLHVSPGVLKLPWRPRIRAFDTYITWHLRPEDGLVGLQEQTWSISAAEALYETFFGVVLLH